MSRNKGSAMYCLFNELTRYAVSQAIEGHVLRYVDTSEVLSQSFIT